MTLAEAFRRQAAACEALGSPFMARLMGLCAERLRPDHGPIAARLFAWRGDVSAAGHSLPLRLAGGLHALRLRGHGDLAKVYPPHAVPNDQLWATVSAVIRAEASTLDRWLDSPPQTNELRRAAVVRAVAQWLTALDGLPMEVLELGASAGLNLNFDRFALNLGGKRFGPHDPVITLAPAWTGAHPPDAEPVITDRAGVDLAPVDPASERMRLMAYLWPDQMDRLARMDAVLTLPAQPVDRGDAADWLETRLIAPQPANTRRFIYHTIAWQYFPPDTDLRARAALDRAGQAATAARPLAIFGMESDGQAPGAALTLRLWPGDHRVELGRVDFHCRWVDWRAPSGISHGPR
ncbi:DUF2332 domain-containing protein [Jannaschia sp. M317]|uniref:DUF2332 domain-containing protein n=1 Tax=Jannaschia sp. M317 TaxID=2867011 RepID=UPI0021A77085|nr:DUF2332 family protein [Jannaschia sp. M317]UWQ17620.1 DUF2332 family protein [Jannaschia sp. M317]